MLCSPRLAHAFIDDAPQSCGVAAPDALPVITTPASVAMPMLALDVLAALQRIADSHAEDCARLSMLVTHSPESVPLALLEMARDALERTSADLRLIHTLLPAHVLVQGSRADLPPHGPTSR
jgi:hypothetical protein